MSAEVVSRDINSGLVTTEDQANTDLIVTRINDRFRGQGVYTEELAKGPEFSLPDNNKIWVVDEIDGTNNYSRGIGKELVLSPDWSISIGLRGEKGEGLIGVVYAPDHDALFYASKGNGAFMEKDGRTVKLQVSGEESKDRFNMSFNVNISPDQLTNIMIGIGNSEIVKKLKPRIRESSALELCYVAGGTDDAFIHTKTQAHDVAAGLVIAQEAGAKVSWLNDNKTVLVSNVVIHSSLEGIVANTLQPPRLQR